MNRFNVILGVLATAALLAIGNAQTGAQGQSQTQRQIGRYQIFSGEHNLFGVNQIEKSILRLDTATGIVEEWATGVDKGGATINRWVAIGNQ